MGIVNNINSGDADKVTNAIDNIVDNAASASEDKGMLESELQKAERQYELEKARMNIEEDKVALEDRKNARDREYFMQSSPNATTLGKNITAYLAIAATALCFCLFYIVVINPDLCSETNNQILTYILGVLSALLSQVYSYYFGSSAGSSRKGETLAQALETKDQK
jgi:hypothetical protein